jgi:hypothetical protein
MQCALCHRPPDEHVTFHDGEPRDEDNLHAADFPLPSPGLYCPNGPE